MFRLRSERLNLVAGGCYCYCMTRPVGQRGVAYDQRIGVKESETDCSKYCLNQENIQLGYYGFSRCTETIQDYEPMVYSEEYYAFQERMKQVDASSIISFEDYFSYAYFTCGKE